MSWYPDLSTETMVATGEHVRAVGWLSAARSFPMGGVPAEFITRLREFVRLASESAEALSFVGFAGWHDCELCEQERGAGNFGVPAGPVLYIAPAMIAHYVERHGYRPPAAFVTAVMESPLPDTAEYRAATVEFGRLHSEWWTAYFKRSQAELGGGP